MGKALCHGQMGQSMMAHGAMDELMEKECLLIPKGKYMRGLGLMIKPMDSANTLTKMERLMKAPGLETYRMVRELSSGPTAHLLVVIIIKERRQDLVLINGSMVLNIQENG